MKIALLGDIALFGCYSLKENQSLGDKLSLVADYLNGFDLVVGNLETPFSRAKKHSGAKSAYICSDEENIEVLKLLHIDAVSLANNHMFDFGYEGYELTKRVLDDAGIKWFGTEGKDLLIEEDGNRLAFSGFCCYSTNPLQCVSSGKYGVNAFNLETARKKLGDNMAEGFLGIFAVHAGIEHVNYPSYDHILAGRKLAEFGKYLYYGHHPHVIQGVEEYKGSLIAHSLGNFCFDDVYTSASTNTPLVKLTDNNRTGLVFEVEIKNNCIIDWKEQVIYIGSDGEITLINEDDKTKEYNRALVQSQDNIEEYNKRRNSIIEGRLTERKANRDFNWFVKRLRPRYIKLILDMRKNTRLYNENVQKYL